LTLVEKVAGEASASPATFKKSEILIAAPGQLDCRGERYILQDINGFIQPRIR
jgi:hypothetical protein